MSVARRYIKLSCSGGSGNNNHHHISITRCKPNKKKKGKTFSRIPRGRHHRLSWLRLMRLAKMGSDLVRPSLKIVKRHKHTTKKSKEYPKRTRRRCLWIRNDVSNKMNNQGKTTKTKGNDFLPHDSRPPRLWEFVDFSADAPKRNVRRPFPSFLITFEYTPGGILSDVTDWTPSTAQINKY